MNQTIGALLSGTALLATYAYRDQLAYWASLPFTYYQVERSRDMNWYDEISLDSSAVKSKITTRSPRHPTRASDGGRLVLGALPLTSPGNHLDELTGLGVDAVISVVQPFELESGSWGGFRPVKPTDWTNSGVEHHVLESADFRPLSPELISEAVTLIDRLLRESKTVYVHCKAGRGRSAAVVIAYLSKRFNLTAEEALHHVKRYRSQINLNSRQFAAVKKYCHSECQSSNSGRSR